MRGVAFKVNYNDGGANDGLIGYRGVCSDRTIWQNVITEKRPWCSNELCACRVYCDNNFQDADARPVGYPCYESRLLLPPFKFSAGIFRRGDKAGQPIPIKRVEPGDIAFLTTIPPNHRQKDRIIFGCYKVGSITIENGRGYFVESDETMDIRLPDDIARDFYYWDYQEQAGRAFWGSGLFRYLDAERTQTILNAILRRLGNTSDRDNLYNALVGSMDPQHLTRGSGGEGEAHRKLKEMVSRNPRLIGLPQGSVPSVEHPFLSGDRVDIKFDLPDGAAAVVEIETEIPLPGAHQAIKYRALLEVERGEDLNSGRVQAILVAHRFDEQTREIAEQYKIKLVELRA